MNIWNRITNLNQPSTSGGWNRTVRTTRRLLLMALLGTLALMLAVPKSGLAIASLPNLGTAGSFGALAGSAVTNTGPTTVNGNVGVSPGTAVTGFPPGTLSGTIHPGDSVALQAHNDATTAFGQASGQACDFNLTGQDLGGKTLIPGVYCFNSSAQLTGQLTLDGQGNRNSIFIFQIGSTITTASNARVQAINNGQPCNVFWQVGSSATLGTNTHFAGNILALTSITLNTGTTTSSGLYALNGAVTLDTNTIQACGFVQAPTNTPTPVSALTATATSTSVPSTATARPAATNTPTNTRTRVPRPRATNVPTQSPGTISTPTAISTSTQPPQNTAVPTDTAIPVGTVTPNDTATAIALATESPVPPTTPIGTDTPVSTPLITATGTAIETATSTSLTETPTTAIAISTGTVVATVASTSTPISTATVPGATAISTQVTMSPSPFLPRTGSGGGNDQWAGSVSLLLGVVLLLIGLATRMLFLKLGIRVRR